jgi:hypothetical protein
MDIKELCKLCSKYSANEVKLDLEMSFKKRVIGSWDENSKGMKKINDKIYYLKSENEMIKEKIKSVSNITFK